VAKPSANVSYRQVNAAVHDVAAELERRSQALEAKWVISPTSYNRRIVVEFMDDADLGAASEMISQVLKEFGLR